MLSSLSWKDPLEKEMATHSSILTWKIPWTEEPGELQSMGLQRDTTEHTCAHTGYKKLSFFLGQLAPYGASVPSMSSLIPCSCLFKM